MNINNNIIHVRQNLPVGVTLIAVSKTQPVEAIEQAYAGGQRVFGENKVQELVPKHEALPKDIQWHMIGHLQSNKVKYIAPFVHLIHGVDSAKLLEEINKQAVKAGRTLDCLLQVHIAEEETKFGFSPEEVTAFLESPGLSSLGNVRVMGLMGMATFTDNKEQIKREFGSLKTLFDRLKASSLPTHVRMQELSMGMSGDYALAIEQGRSMIRVGTAIFGSRHKTA